MAVDSRAFGDIDSNSKRTIVKIVGSSRR